MQTNANNANKIKSLDEVLNEYANKIQIQYNKTQIK